MSVPLCGKSAKMGKDMIQVFQCGTVTPFLPEICRAGLVKVIATLSRNTLKIRISLHQHSVATKAKRLKSLLKAYLIFAQSYGLFRKFVIYFVKP